MIPYIFPKHKCILEHKNKNILKTFCKNLEKKFLWHSNEFKSEFFEEQFFFRDAPFCQTAVLAARRCKPAMLPVLPRLVVVGTMSDEMKAKNCEKMVFACQAFH